MERNYNYKEQNKELKKINLIFEKNKNTNNDYYEKIGFECFGPYLYGFVNWLKEEFEMNNISKVFFLSRDGYIMKKAFDYINDDSKIKTSYLEVSRRSLRVPTYSFNNQVEQIIKTFSNSKYISIDTVFDNIGLKKEKYINVLEKYGIKDKTYDRKELIYSEKFVNLIQKLKKDIIENANKELANLKEYIKEKEIKGKFAIVDIGWSGSMQRFLCETLDRLNINYEMYGYYTGIEKYYEKNIKIYPNMKMKGYLFDFKNKKNEIDPRQSFVGLYETFFLERNGSVEKYEIINEKACAIRYPYEYRINGMITYEAYSVKKIQEKAIKFIEEAYKCKICSLKIAPIDLFQGIKKIGENPNLKDAKNFGNFRFFDEGETKYLAKPEILKGNLKKQFLESRWKIGFLKRILIIKLPYNKIFSFLRKFK